MGQGGEPTNGLWSLLFDLLAVAVGAGVILLMLRWLGAAIPFLQQIGLA